MLSIESVALAKTYTDTIKEIVGAGFTPKVVSSLPTTGSSAILYLVKKTSGGSSSNVYDEYLWVDGTYEHIGDTSTAMPIDTQIDAASENPVQNKAIAAALETKVDKVDGKSLTSNDYTDAEKAKVDAIPTDPKYTDTIYDDKDMVDRITAIEAKGLTWDAKQDALTPEVDYVTPAQITDFITKEVDDLTNYRSAADQDVIDTTKVDKITGKGLSTNDYSAADKAKVDAIPANPKYTDTVYDDTTLTERVAAIEGKEDSWDAKQDKLVAKIDYVTPVQIADFITADDVDLSVYRTAENQDKIDATKVDKVSGKGLSTEDFTTELKTKLEEVAAEATKTIVDNTLSDDSVNPVQNKVIKAAIDAKQDPLTPRTDYVIPEQISTFITANVDNLKHYYTVTEIDQKLSDFDASNFVEKEDGKGLSTEDFTTAEKVKLQNIAAYATHIEVDDAFDDNRTNPVQGKVIKVALDNKLDIPTTSISGVSSILAYPGGTQTDTMEFENQTLTTTEAGQSKVPSSFAVSRAIAVATQGIGDATWTQQLFDVSTNKNLLIKMKARNPVGKFSIKFVMYGIGGEWQSGDNVFYSGEIVDINGSWNILTGWKNVPTDCPIYHAGGGTATSWKMYHFKPSDKIDHIRIWYDPSEVDTITFETPLYSFSPITDLMTKLDAE